MAVGANGTIDLATRVANLESLLEVGGSSANGLNGLLQCGEAPPPVLASADGAITATSGTVLITKASAAALTLAAPTAGAISAGGDDGKILRIVSVTAAAHTVTNTSPGFNAAGSGGDVATYGAAKGNAMEIQAYQGVWYATNLTGVTLG